MSTSLSLPIKLKRECKKMWAKYIQKNTMSRELLNTKPNYVVMIVIDGISKMVLEKAETPTIHELTKEGVYVGKCFTVFPTVTPTTHVSLNTGAYPETTGYVSWSFRKHLLCVNTANKAETLAEAANKMGYRSAAICEAAARGANVMISEAVCGFDLEKTTKFAERILKEHRPNLVNMTYYCTDDISQKFGPESSEALSTLEYVDSCIEKLRKSLKDLDILEETLFIITADHGIISVSNIFPKEKMLESIKELRVKPIFNDRTIRFCYKEKEKIENELVGRLSNLDGVGYLFTKPELILLGSNVPKIGKSVLTMNEDYYCGQYHRGMHGGYSEVEVNIPLILSGCGINRNSRIKLARIIDVAPTVAYLLGVPQPKNADGRILIESLDGQFELENVNRINEIREKNHKLIDEINKFKKAFAVGEIVVKEYKNEKTRMLAEAYKLRNQEKTVTKEIFARAQS